MVNASGWLLLTGVFGSLLLLVQRAERNRRLATFFILLFVASLASSYGIYRISNECNLFPKQLCALPQFKERARIIAYTTVNLAAVTAIALNILFWIFIGRYNPPGSSEAIKVLGMND